MADIVALLVPNVVLWAFEFVLLAWDEGRMTDAERERAWPIASRRIAVVLFSPICVPLHFLRTRRSVRGVAEAVVASVVVVAVLLVIGLALNLVFPEAS